MSFRRVMRALAVCLVLQIGVLFQVPMRPEQIEALMCQFSQPKLAFVLPSEDKDSDPS